MTLDRRHPLLLATAIEAALEAGAIQTSYTAGTVRVDKKGRIDLVTEVDLRVEREVRALLARRFPDHTVLGEELGSDRLLESARYRWLFDPLDGTTNYAHGFPVFCTSLALEVDGQIELGVVYDPTRRELFTAQRGGGAYLNGAPLIVSGAGMLVESMLVTGFPYDVDTRSEDLVEVFARFLAEARAVRRLGSAALDLCYVAAGRLDGFWEQGLKPWDVAAGALIVEESRGRVTAFDGATFSPYGHQIVASNGRIHDAMLRVIAGNV